ncbi:MAG: hydrogenase iron-sulfur subunit [Polyangiaceae bacterium]|nr:hydrogenase iron-sulfur subunit [Polyangiaceae bacterium]
MARTSIPDVVVDICHHCVPMAQALPRQWSQHGALVVSHELPCSGKVDIQYLLHAVGEVGRGLCVVACPRGQCRLAQGNLRAEMRVGTLHKLLAEIGLEPERAELLHCDPHASAESLTATVRAAVDRLVALGPNPAWTVGVAARPGVGGSRRPSAPVRIVASAWPEPTPSRVEATCSARH